MKLLFLLLSGSLLFACTITKRNFNSGYHIEWRKSVDKQKAPTKSMNEFYSEQTDSKEGLVEKVVHHSSDLDFKMQQDSNLLAIQLEKPHDFKLTENRVSTAIDSLKTTEEKQGKISH